jgi:hypothetical protein
MAKRLEVKKVNVVCENIYKNHKLAFSPLNKGYKEVGNGVCKCMLTSRCSFYGTLSLQN